MYSRIDKNKSIHPHKAKQTKRISRLIKALKSFDEKRTLKKSKSPQSKILNQKHQINKNLIINLPIKNSIIPSPHTAQRYTHNYRHHDNISTISKSSKYSGKKVSLPSISLDIYFSEQRNLTNRTPQTVRLKTEIIKLPKVFMNKVQGAPTGNLLQFLRLKPTEKYLSKKQNVRLAQKLLLAEPSKDLRRCQHNKFYEDQKSYRSISQSSLKLNHNHHSFSQKKSKHHKHSKSQWIS